MNGKNEPLEKRVSSGLGKFYTFIGVLATLSLATSYFYIKDQFATIPETAIIKNVNPATIYTPNSSQSIYGCHVIIEADSNEMDTRYFE